MYKFTISKVEGASIQTGELKISSSVVNYPSVGNVQPPLSELPTTVIVEEYLPIDVVKMFLKLVNDPSYINTGLKNSIIADYKSMYYPLL